MKLYFAGNIGLLRCEQTVALAGCRNRLVSYADYDTPNHASCPKFWIEQRTALNERTNERTA